MAEHDVIRDLDSIWLVVVAVDNYSQDAIDDLPGAGCDLLKVVEWAGTAGIAPAQTILHLPKSSSRRADLGELLARRGHVVVDPTEDSQYLAVLPTPAPNEVLLLDSSRESIALTCRTLIDPKLPRSDILLFFLHGHGVLLMDAATRVFLTENAGFHDATRNITVMDLPGSLAKTLAQSRFTDVVLVYDACSKRAFSTDEREKLKPGELGVPVGEPHPNCSVHVVTSSGLYEPAVEGGTGSDFLVRLLEQVDPTEPSRKIVHADATTGFHVDLRPLFEEPVLHDVFGELRQSPQIRTVSGPDRGFTPVLRLDLVEEEPLTFKVQQLIEKKRAMLLKGRDPVASARDHIRYAGRLRLLHHRAELLKEVVQLSRAGQADGVEARAVALALSDLVVGCQSVPGGLLIPDDLVHDFKTATKHDLPDCSRRVSEYAERSAPLDDHLLLDLLERVIIPLRRAAEGALVQSLERVVDVVGPRGHHAETDRASLAARLWALAEDQLLLSARFPTPPVEDADGLAPSQRLLARSFALVLDTTSKSAPSLSGDAVASSLEGVRTGAGDEGPNQESLMCLRRDAQGLLDRALARRVRPSRSPLTPSLKKGQ